MSHPNEDFLKRFLGENKISPAQQKAMLRKKRMADYFDKVNNPKPNVLKEENKKEILAATEKIFYRAKESSILTEAKKQTWLEKKTPFGIFFFNPEQQVWMNSWGVVKKNFNDFFAATGYESSGDDGSPISPIVPNPIELVRLLSFSDEGSYLAGYAEDTQANSYINVYSLDYSGGVTPTLEHTVSLGGITFDGSTGQTCIVSENGAYLLLASSDIRRVYFFDVVNDVLLQTITDDSPGFGEKIAADRDFYGIAIASSQLNKAPSIYDTRSTSWDASTKIHYYKRNYTSFSNPKFKKVFSTNAHAQMRKSGIDAETLVATATGGFPQAGYGNIQLESSQSTDAGVYRVSDLKTKGYNFALSSLALKTDQIDYRAPFFNIDSPRYDFITDPGFTYPSSISISKQAVMLVNNQPNIDLGFDPLPTDAQCESVFKILTLPSVKQFSLSRVLNGTVVDDKSYYSMASKAPVVWGENIPQTFLTNPAGLTYFNQNIVGSYAEKTYIRGLLGLRVTTTETDTTLNNSNPVIDEQVLNTKIGINDDHTYHVSQVLTSNTVKSIRIYRSLNVGTDGIKTYNYQDYGITGTTSGVSVLPSFETVGMVKILFASADQSALENTFFDNASIASNVKQRVGPVATKPFLSNPANCPNAEFAFPVDSSIINDTILNVYCSNTLLFVNFATQTMVFDIDPASSYLPVKHRITLSSLYQYKFAYNQNGSFFSLQNDIYKFDTGTNQLVLQHSI